MDQVPHTAAEREAMLAAIGVRSLDELFAPLPPEVRCGELKLPPGLSEMELARVLRARLSRNRSTQELACFLGAGAYDHYLPPAVLELAARGELYTAYTPYQPEISQGLLQAIYEYQSMIAELTGTAYANASLYDGATALAEACQLALRQTGRGKVLLDAALHPYYLATVQTALLGQGVEAHLAALPPGEFLNAGLSGRMRMSEGQYACVAAGYPNFYGAVADVSPLIEVAHAQGALAVVVANPFVLSLLRPPGAMGADLVCGDAQPFGLPLQYGGPYLGYLACAKELIRRMPGRLVGRTVDQQGRQAFALTLQAREQHIRREKASSNICTNQALCALLAHFYLSCVGPAGLRRAGELCASNSDLLRRKLKTARGVKSVPEYPVFHEFVYETVRPAAETLQVLLDHGILGGLDLGRFEKARAHQILVCATEKRTAEELGKYLEALEASAR